MAIETISNTVASYQEMPSSIQKDGTKLNMAQNMNVSNTGTSDATVSKALNEQKNSTDENSQQKNSQANAQRMKSAVAQANTKLKQVRTGCEFSYNEDVNRVSIKVYDKETKEVIREIPPEESLEMLQKVWEIAGLLVDERR
jgi:flagellar protein FlaG